MLSQIFTLQTSCRTITGAGASCLHHIFDADDVVCDINNCQRHTTRPNSFLPPVCRTSSLARLSFFPNFASHFADFKATLLLLHYSSVSHASQHCLQ